MRPRAASTIAKYIAGYASDEVQSFIGEKNDDPPISFLDYDWSLNDATPGQ